MKNKIFSEKIKYDSELFEKGYISEDKSIEMLFKILVYPSWEAEENWQFFKNGDAEDTYFIVRSICIEEYEEKNINIYLNEMKLEKVIYNKGFMNPIVIRQSFEIDELVITSILNQLKDLKISPIPENDYVGMDGTMYKLIVNRRRCMCQYTWWEDGADNWKEMTMLVLDTIYNLKEYIEQLLNEE